ncbi:MAG: GatB/YqeY domain-containing protein [Actinomycetes bacterium]
MSLQQRIADDLKTAMKARDRDAMSTLRMLVSALKNEAIAKGRGPQGELSDDEVLRVLAGEKKRRDEAATAFAEGGREEAAAREAAESAVIAAYLPEQLADDELDAIVDAKVAEVGATSPKEMGQVIKAVMAEVGNRAEGGRVSAAVKARLVG